MTDSSDSGVERSLLITVSTQVLAKYLQGGAVTDRRLLLAADETDDPALFQLNSELHMETKL